MSLNEFEHLRLELRRGCLVLAVLAKLRSEYHGYALVKELRDGGLEIDENTLYPLLRRLENQTLLTTQSQLITAEHDAALAEFNVAAATGRLIAPELKLPVKLYDMERHYKQVKDKWIGFRGGLSE